MIIVHWNSFHRSEKQTGNNKRNQWISCYECLRWAFNNILFSTKCITNRHLDFCYNGRLCTVWKCMCQIAPVEEITLFLTCTMQLVVILTVIRYNHTASKKMHKNDRRLQSTSYWIINTVCVCVQICSIYGIKLLFSKMNRSFVEVHGMFKQDFALFNERQIFLYQSYTEVWRASKPVI